MAEYRLFSDAQAALLGFENDMTSGTYGTRFYVFGVTGWRVGGIRIFVPTAAAGLATSGYVAKIYASATGAEIASKTKAGGLVAGWNEIRFDSPADLLAGSYYTAALFMPSGGYSYAASLFKPDGPVSPETPSLWAASDGEAGMGNGLYVYGAAPANPTTGAVGGGWLGIDVIVDDGTGGGGGTSPEDALNLTDLVSFVRGGLATTVTFTGTATDSLGASKAGTVVATVETASAPAPTYTKSLFEHNISWGSAADPVQHGPNFLNDIPTELGIAFTLQWSARSNSCRVYKAPNLEGDIPVTIWGPNGTALATTTVTWVRDAGGWRTIQFPTTVDMLAGVEYRVSYWSPTGVYSYSPWVFNAQPRIDSPFVVPNFFENINGKFGGSVYGTTHNPPTQHSAHNYYVDPIVTWNVLRPLYGRNAVDYFAQFENGPSGTKFPLQVFYVDPPWLKDYADIGINGFMGIPIGGAGYRDAILAAKVDIWADIASGPEPAEQIASDPTLAQYIKGYHVVDEPEMSHNPHTPDQIRKIITDTRRIDSTRPMYVGLGKPTTRAQGYTWVPADMPTSNDYIRQFSEVGDMLGADDYTIVAKEERFGTWTYGPIMGRLQDNSQGRIPVYALIETCDAGLGMPREPTWQEIHDASWAAIIGGASGIIYFDHRFGNAFHTQDFAAALHDPARAVPWKASNAEIAGLSVALLGPDQNYVSSVTSSNTTAGPYGGTYGVPIEYIARTQAGKRYVFAQASRPGATTATFHIPSAAGKALTVLGEFRAVAVDAAGYFTDEFTADYQVHKYEWTP